MEKKELRKLIRERKRQFTGKQLEELSLPIMNRLLGMSEVANADTILMYYSLPDEVFTHDTVELLARQGAYWRLWSRQAGGFLSDDPDGTPPQAARPASRAELS